MKRKARVRYTNKCEFGQDGYAVEIYSDGEWGLDTFFPITNSQIHAGIINKLSMLKDCGYEVRYV